MEIRLNKFLQENLGISRRNADNLIRQGKVIVDGRVAHPGQKIDPRKQKVLCEGKLVRPRRRKKLYYVFHKPTGYICSRRGFKTIYDGIPKKLRHLDYVGRLDVNTSGVLLLTDDGEFAQKIMRSRISRLYQVELNEPLSDDAAAVLRDGPFLDGRRVDIGAVEIDGRNVLVELFEGRCRAVRRMFGALGYEVKTLVRIRFGPVELGELPEAQLRPLTGTELKELRRQTENSCRESITYLA